MTVRQLPLTGIKVVEFCQIAAGPFCGMLLADMGADVIKVEHPTGGDGLRQWPPLTSGFSENFASLNRNKRSVALDLKDPVQHRLASRICYGADVIVENNRPGVMDRLNLGYRAISRVNPRIVFASISGFGQSGPRAREGGFDVTAQAIGGVMSVTGEPGGNPTKCGVPVSDFSAGLYAAFAIASALRAVARDGKGQHIDVSLLGATLGIAALQTSEYFGTGRSPVKLGAAHPRNAPYEAFSAADDWFVMAAGNEKLWLSVCAILGREDLATDPRFKSNRDRAARQPELHAILEAEFTLHPVAYWIEALNAAGVPCGVINTYESALDDPQVQAMGWVQDITLPNGVTTRTFGSPIRLGGQTLAIRRNPPALGEHNQDIFAEFG